MDALAGGQSAQVRDRYFALLRRAAVVGWQAAKTEYLPDQIDRGRIREEALAELVVFERLNASAVSAGIDPILAQRRRDVYADGVRPVAIGLGLGVCALGAAAGGTLAAVMLLSSGATLAALTVGRALVLRLLR